MEIIRARTCRTTPWKNGGGSTTEIAAAPAGASLETFDWRISMARVASDGPFSHFADIDRTLAVVDGSGMELTIDGRRPVVLTHASDPIAFPGDVATSARLLAGDITDLNVMTRRGRYAHRISRLAGPVTFGDDADIAVVLAVRSGAELVAEGTTASLEPGDAALLRPSAGAGFGVTQAGDGACYLILIREIRQ